MVYQYVGIIALDFTLVTHILIVGGKKSSRRANKNRRIFGRVQTK